MSLLPPNLGSVSHGAFRGDIDLLTGIASYIRKSKQTYVILSLGNFIYNMAVDTSSFSRFRGTPRICIYLFCYRNP